MKRNYPSGYSKKKRKELRLQSEVKGRRTLEQLNWGKSETSAEDSVAGEQVF